MLNAEQKKKLSEFCFDIAKISFGGLVVGALIKGGPFKTLIGGLCFVTLSVITGTLLLRRL
ncbi:hypothetical protein [Thermosulfurimonas sp. F29]|uniref:hypothetical protein n=1 Tax=Thermosulfurimonas sp. F29 TaxID=2867247 RepID=UPI001C8366C7|nr:hypothetical protein [Thermosulfurimonas sp. F29]MBX6422621.1 hypothetical protein [Thermosulfurimonas sp. F29]